MHAGRAAAAGTHVPESRAVDATCQLASCAVPCCAVTLNCAGMHCHPTNAVQVEG